MRHEAGAVLGDQRAVLADTDAAGAVADDPAADQRIVAVEGGQRMAGLADARTIAVRAVGAQLAAVVQVHGDVGALARMQRLAHPAARQLAAVVERGRQQVRVAAMGVPQQRQDALVAQQRLPRRLDQLQAGARQVLAERLAEHVLQRIQLEQAADHVVVEVGEAAVGGDAEVLDRQHAAVDAGLQRAVAQVGDRALVLHRVAHRGEVERPRDAARDRAERFHQGFVDRVELVAAGRQPAACKLVFQPLPLEESGLEQRGRGVVIQFVELGRAGAVVGEVHAAVQVRLALAPALRDPVAVRFRDRQLLHVLLAADDALDHVQRHRVQLLAGRLDVDLDLAQAERVVRRLVPVRRVVDGVETEAARGSLRAPVGALGRGDPAHQPPMPRLLPDVPKPERLTVTARFGVALTGTIAVPAPPR